MRFLFALCLIIPSLAFGYGSSRQFSGQKIITSCDMSTTSCGSLAIDAKYLDNVSVQAIFTGSPVGALSVQVSNDTTTAQANVGTWTDYSGMAYTISAAGDIVFNMSNVGSRWIRLVYYKTSGTGTLNAYVSGKGAQ